MKYPEGTAEYEFRKTAQKYGASILFELFNYICVATGIGFVVAVISYVLTGSESIDYKTDLGYAAMMILNDIYSYAAPALVFFLMFRNELKETRFIPAYPKIPGELILLFFTGGSLARWGSVITNYIAEYLNAVFNIPEPQAAFSSSGPQNTIQFLIFSFFVVFTGPIFEELIYRHLLLKPLRKYGDVTAAVMSSLIFGLSHFNFDQFLYTFIFGFSLAVIAIRRGSVIPAMVVHIINNAIATLSVYSPETFGNAVVDGMFASLADILNFLGIIVLFGGLAAVVIAAVLHIFDLWQPIRIPTQTQLKILFTSPLVIIGIIGSLAMAFLLLYV